MPVGFGIVVQQLNRRQDRVLAIGYLAGARAGDGWFSPGDLANLFEALRLPRPGNISQELARLREDELVVRRRTGGSWSLTPTGEDMVVRLVGDVDAAAVGAEMAVAGAAEFAGVEHPLIPPELAPIRFQPAVARLLEVSPFERNVFCMTRFPAENGGASDPISGTLARIREVLADHSLVMHLASDRQADDELFGNIAAHIWGSKYGIALLETLDQESAEPANSHLNDNMLIEVGAMLISGRRCALLKDKSAPKPPTDFVAQIYRELDLTDLDAVAEATDRWVGEDLQVGN